MVKLLSGIIKFKSILKLLMALRASMQSQATDFGKTGKFLKVNLSTE
jgi:hypothetical protein